MDFLDPKKVRRNQLTLLVGYALITIAITVATCVLLYQSYGYGVDKDGKVIQNGLVFVSSQPSGADIIVDGKAEGVQTNARLQLPGGTYTLKLTAAGYRDWQHQVTVNGGDVQRYDYALLFPKTLQTKRLSSFETTPEVMSQSPDKRWLLVKNPDAEAAFLLYDLKDPAKPTATTLTLPAAAFTANGTAPAWSAVEWSSDNRHLLLLHTFTLEGATRHEYVMLDRSAADSSINVSTALNLNDADTLSLFNKKYNQYYAFDAGAHSLRTVSLDSSVPEQELSGVRAYKSYGDDTILYVTSQPPSGKTMASDKVMVVLQQGQKTYNLRTLPADSPAYVLDIAKYNGLWYAAAGAQNDSGVYVYKNPQTQTTAVNAFPAAWRFLQVSSPTKVSFSANTQFIAVQGGQQVEVYDAKNVKTYRYTLSGPLDSPQIGATWIDGTHLAYVSAGKYQVFEYDYQNLQQLQAALPAYVPVYDSSYSYLFTMSAGKDGAAELTITPLRITQ